MVSGTDRPIAGRAAGGPTRRTVLGTIGAGMLAAIGPAASAAGGTDPRLAAYDRMMDGFMARHRPPGASLAVSRDGRLVYARGFGLADAERQAPVGPQSLFRIASISKPFTATAVLHLVQQGRLRLDDRILTIVRQNPFLARGARLDERLHEVTVRQCLQHTAGWDRDKVFDPMSAGAAEEIARALRLKLPIRPEHIIRYTFGRPLDWEPGTRYAYSNFGYCVLGRVIEAASGLPYHEYVGRHVLHPIGISGMRLGRNLLADRAPDEVRYEDSRHRTGRAVAGPEIGKPVPLPYGVECIETMDANGGWIASAIMLVRFADAFNDSRRSALLDEAGIRTMLARPDGKPGLANGKPADTYYGCGWQVHPADERQGRYTKWHTGLLAGSSTLLVARPDGLNWAVLFNSDADRSGAAFAGTIDPLLHQVADSIAEWPAGDLYGNFRATAL